MQSLVPGFKTTMLAYHKACLECTMRIIRLLALALDLPANFFDKDFTHPIASLRPLHYMPSVSLPDQVNLRIIRQLSIPAFLACIIYGLIMPWGLDAYISGA